MARTVRRVAGGNPPGDPPKQPPAEAPAAAPATPWRVRRVMVDSRQLLDFGPAWYGWSQTKLEPFTKDGLVKGAICKVTPPAGTPEEKVLEVETYLRALGARQVRVMPSEPEDKPTVADPKEPQAASAPARTLRQVVMDRAARMQAPRDRKALEDTLTEAMDHGEGGG